MDRDSLHNQQRHTNMLNSSHRRSSRLPISSAPARSCAGDRCQHNRGSKRLDFPSHRGRNVWGYRQYDRESLSGPRSLELQIARWLCGTDRSVADSAISYQDFDVDGAGWWADFNDTPPGSCPDRDDSGSPTARKRLASTHRAFSCARAGADNDDNPGREPCFELLDLWSSRGPAASEQYGPSRFESTCTRVQKHHHHPLTSPGNGPPNHPSRDPRTRHLNRFKRQYYHIHQHSHSPPNHRKLHERSRQHRHLNQPLHSPHLRINPHDRNLHQCPRHRSLLNSQPPRHNPNHNQRRRLQSSHDISTQPLHPTRQRPRPNHHQQRNHHPKCAITIHRVRPNPRPRLKHNPRLRHLYDSPSAPNIQRLYGRSVRPQHLPRTLSRGHRTRSPHDRLADHNAKCRVPIPRLRLHPRRRLNHNARLGVLDDRAGAANIRVPNSPRLRAQHICFDADTGGCDTARYHDRFRDHHGEQPDAVCDWIADTDGGRCGDGERDGSESGAWRERCCGGVEHRGFGAVYHRWVRERGEWDGAADLCGERGGEVGAEVGVEGGWADVDGGSGGCGVVVNNWVLTVLDRYPLFSSK